jgi:hypothetical protein
MRLLRITKALVLVVLLSAFVFTSTQIYANSTVELCVEIRGKCVDRGCFDNGGDICGRIDDSQSVISDPCWCIVIEKGVSKKALK